MLCVCFEFNYKQHYAELKVSFFRFHFVFYIFPPSSFFSMLLLILVLALPLLLLLLFLHNFVCLPQFYSLLVTRHHLIVVDNIYYIYFGKDAASHQLFKLLLLASSRYLIDLSSDVDVSVG